jgi:hypothetical protein
MEGISIMISSDRILSQQQIYNFLRSATIKFDPVAQYINETVMKNGYSVNPYDRSTWKYYLNIVGKYHVSDEKMYVTSVDTRQPILFSPEVLADNLRTRSAYMPGGIYYNRLCDRYPNQVDLIKSILFPAANLTEVIESPDLTLLAYGKGYLEIYEESILVAELENFLEIYKERWYFDFLSDEPYFYLTAWGSLWFYLGALLMAKRVENIKTPYVHSFDLWNALKGAGLDDYSDILDREKSMMLYQNIDYLKANAGKQSNLNILALRLLKSLGIGLYGRNVVQESETGAKNYQLTPQLVPVLLPTDSEALPAQIEVKTVAVIQSEIFQKGLSQSNSAEEVASIERKLGDTTLNNFATKFLEIKPLAQHKPYAETLNAFLLETLTVSVMQGYYTQPIEVLDPLTNSSIYLPPSELLGLYHYAVCKSIGIDTTTFPNVVQLYRSFNPHIETPKKIISYFETPLYLSMSLNVDDYMSGLEYDKHIQSPLEFSQNVTNLWLRFMYHRLEDQKSCDGRLYEAHSYLQSLCHTRRQETFEFVKGYATYEDWFGPGGIDLTDTIFSQYDIQSDPRTNWSNLADAIISTLIPMNDTLEIFGNFTFSNSGYERLRQLFVQMCSYRVVFLESERDTPEFMAGPKWLNHYGPDTTRSFADFIVAITSQAIDSVVLDDAVFIDRGVMDDHSISMTEQHLVLKETTQHIVETKIDQFIEPAPFGMTTPSVATTQGVLQLSGTRMSTIMLEP